MRQARSLVVRLLVNYLVLSILLLLAGWRIGEHRVFSTWIVALVYTLLAVTVRRWLLVLSLPLIIKTAGLFVCVVDSVILALTAILTGLGVDSVWWVLVGVAALRVATLLAEQGLRALGKLRAETDRSKENRI